MITLHIIDIHFEPNNTFPHIWILCVALFDPIGSPLHITRFTYPQRERVYPWCLLPDAFWKFLGMGQLVLAVPAIMFIVGMRVMDKNLYPSVIRPLLQR